MMIATMIHEYFMGEKDSLFITMTDLLEQIRRAYNNPTIEDPVAQFMSVKHLYIDDIGVEKVTEWVVQTVDRLINHRYNWMLRTSISSNFTPQELAERFEARIASRIVGMCSLVAVEGRDRRLVK
jgi:DNA replication protein DnaC